ncbi:MAG TPA: cell division FtsA domain-containing protein, partial [Candidatus Acidoferrum sp.]|nr:cell division FtsA domain-containing protein [Candidatus Acidoferrum sp.]
MKRRSTLPLGVDVGRSRTRVALLERDKSGIPRLLAVAVRPSGPDPASAIADARDELATRERRCVLALGAPDTLVRTASFPAMGRAERERAARYEAARFVPYPIAEGTIRVEPLGEGRCVIAVAHRPALESRIDAARKARLRPIAVDDGAFALCRAFPHADAVIDIGEDQTTLIVAGDPIPSTRTFEIGGRAFTRAIVTALGIDESVAEQRKRSIGLAGAGERARDALVEQLASALIETRAAARVELREIALAGNGARLTGLPEALERAVQIPVRLGALAPDAALDLPSDVVRAA